MYQLAGAAAVRRLLDQHRGAAATITRFCSAWSCWSSGSRHGGRAGAGRWGPRRRGRLTGVRECSDYVLVTPAHNEADLIEQTIRSVVAQTVPPKRWVIVSDGSSDGTDDIVRR